MMIVMVMKLLLTMMNTITMTSGNGDVDNNKDDGNTGRIRGPRG